MINIKTILENVIEHGASDLHINVGMPPILRRNTELAELDFPAISNEDAKEMVLSMIGPDRYKKFEECMDLDFSTNLDDGHRFRVNAHFQRDTIAISFRVIPNQIPLLDDLHLPPIVKELTDLPRGLVLVTGHTGSGKSTSLAAMVDVINTKYRKRIITLEDPIEYMIENKNSMIEQREIGSDCTEFASGLKHALRQDPYIIMVGEMRDLETTGSTITAAETGHLVFATSYLVLSHLMSDRRNRLKWDSRVLIELIEFGKWIFASTMLTFLAGQFDRLLFGKLVPLSVTPNSLLEQVAHFVDIHACRIDFGHRRGYRRPIVIVDDRVGVGALRSGVAIGIPDHQTGAGICQL